MDSNSARMRGFVLYMRDGSAVTGSHVGEPVPSAVGGVDGEAEKKT
jgi:hypothetical protein